MQKPIQDMVYFDIGNTNIKYCVFNNLTKNKVYSIEKLLISEIKNKIYNISKKIIGTNNSKKTSIYICSSISKKHNPSVIEVLNCFSDNIVFIESQKEFNGITNSYKEKYSELGVDRWLGIVSAYSKTKNCCAVIDFGTAITYDFINPYGEHLGGIIVPGMEKMKLLLNSTGQINNNSDSLESSNTGTYGKTTSECINIGLNSIVLDFTESKIKEFCKMATKNNWDKPMFFLSGNGCKSIKKILSSKKDFSCKIDINLIFNGMDEIVKSL
jgi:type III pantothenate kinase